MKLLVLLISKDIPSEIRFSDVVDVVVVVVVEVVEVDVTVTSSVVYTKLCSASWAPATPFDDGLYPFGPSQ